MITLRRASARRRVRWGRHDTWTTFSVEDRPGPSPERFGVVVGLEEVLLPPRAGPAPRPSGEAEILTYMFRGALAQEDSTGSSGVVHAGEFQRMTTSRGLRRKETNASRVDWVHLFRVTFRPARPGLASSHEQKRFAEAERHNVLRVVASPDGRGGSLRILQDAVVCSAVLDPGRHLVHELAPGRSAWLHVISGEASMSDTILSRGDGIGVMGEPAASFTAREKSEVLLLDVAPGRECEDAEAVAPAASPGPRRRL